MRKRPASWCATTRPQPRSRPARSRRAQADVAVCGPPREVNFRGSIFVAALQRRLVSCCERRAWSAPFLGDFERSPRRYRALSNLRRLRAHRRQSQDGMFPGRQLTTWSEPVGIEIDELLQPQRSRQRIASSHVRTLKRSLRDQKPTTHRPPTGHVNPSRMPYLSPSSYDHTSIPIGCINRLTSVQVCDAMLEPARNSAGRNLPRAIASYSSHQPAGTSSWRKADFPSWTEVPISELYGNMDSAQNG